MKKRAVISSIFSASSINPIIAKLSPTDLFLVVERNLKELQGKDFETKRESIRKLKEEFGKIINIELLEVNSLYDLYNITKAIIKKIDSTSDEEIILHISEGRKPLVFGMSFAGYLRKEKVSAIYYLIPENNELLKMPFLNFPINQVQREILKELIEKKQESIWQLKEKIKKSKSVFYKYLKELNTNGYIVIEDSNVFITELGRIVIL